MAGHMRQAAVLAVLGCLVLALGGCGGSQLQPGYVAAANAAVSGTTIASTSAPTDPSASGPVASDLPGTISDQPSLAANTTPGSTGLAAQVRAGQGTGTGAAGPSGHGAGLVAVSAASCEGFHNQTGITDQTITLANVSDITGPVPGIFTSAQQAVKAYVAYFNATSTLCGRKLALLPLDSRTDAGGDQAGYATACNRSFAAVGSMSAFDSGGAATAQACGLLDLRSQSVSDARNACTTCFGAQATQMHAFQNAIPDFFLKHYKAATQHAAMVYVNSPAAVQNAKDQQTVEEKRGMRFVYDGAFDVAEFNYSPYAQRMKALGVRWVQFVGSSDQAVRLAQAMQQADFKPEVFLLDPTGYDPNYVRSGGSAVDGTFVFINFTPFEEAARSPELRLYETWLQQVAPGAAPSYFGVFAWSAARLFMQEAATLGGHLTRKALVSAVSRVHDWTDHGLHAPQNVGGKTNGSCWRFLQLHNGHWNAVGGRQYLCRGSTHS